MLGIKSSKKMELNYFSPAAKNVNSICKHQATNKQFKETQCTKILISYVKAIMSIF